jgi:hypothetical protein
MRSEFCFLIFIIALTACGSNDKILQSGKSTPGNNSTARSAIEDDLTAMRNADFRFVFVLRRKDGAVMDAEDRSVIKANTAEANRRVSSDEDRAFVIGTNNALPPEKLAALYQRFAVENHSPEPPADANSNANAAANTNANSNK